MKRDEKEKITALRIVAIQGFEFFVFHFHLEICSDWISADEINEKRIEYRDVHMGLLIMSKRVWKKEG